MRRSRKLLFRFELVGVGSFMSRENIEEILKKGAFSVTKTCSIDIHKPNKPIHSGHLQLGGKDALGDEAFAVAWAEGRMMTMEQAIAFALE